MCRRFPLSAGWNRNVLLQQAGHPVAGCHGLQAVEEVTTVCGSCHKTLEDTHGRSVGEMKRHEDRTEDLAAASYVFYKSHNLADQLNERLADFMAGHPTFAREFGVYNESAVDGTPDIQSHEFHNIFPGVESAELSSEWAFAAFYGYKEAIIDVICMFDDKGSDLPDDEALTEANIPDPRESDD